MEDFLKIVLLLLLIYFGIKWLFRLLFPYIMRYFAKKIQQKITRSFQQQQTGFFGEYQKMDATNTQKTSQKSKKPVGEYIDFEEID